ncbi:MAG: hypothetical protein WCK42_00935 [Myxococcaceae bacterium]
MKFLFVTFLLAVSASASQTKLCFKINLGNKDFYMDLAHINSDNYVLMVLDSYGKYESSGELKLQSRARCIDCNEDVFDMLEAPGQTMRFEGKRVNAMDPASETGVVYLGSMPVFYTRENCPNYGSIGFENSL